MSDLFKVSGKKFQLKPADGAPARKWTFTHRPGGWIIAESETGERQRLMIFESRGKLSVNLKGRLYFGDLVAEQKHGGGSSGGGDSDLVAQFPGKVRKVLVSEGANVNEGEPLVLVEAMKMEFSIKAPAKGTVTKLLVKEGQQLSPGDRFVDFAEESTSE